MENVIQLNELSKPSPQKADEQKDGPAKVIDRVAEIERLAALEPIDYDVTRVEAAQLLGIRIPTLDREVAKKRRALGLDTSENDDGQGRAVKIADVLPGMSRWMAIASRKA